MIVGLSFSGSTKGSALVEIKSLALSDAFRTRSNLLSTFSKQSSTVILAVVFSEHDI